MDPTSIRSLTSSGSVQEVRGSGILTQERGLERARGVAARVVAGKSSRSSTAGLFGQRVECFPRNGVPSLLLLFLYFI